MLVPLVLLPALASAVLQLSRMEAGTLVIPATPVPLNLTGNMQYTTGPAYHRLVPTNASSAIPASPNGYGGTFYRLGMILDAQGQPVLPLNETATVVDQAAIARYGPQAISASPDFTSLHNPFNNGSLRIITHFEFPQPASMALIYVLQDSATGQLTVENFKPLDWSAYHGLWKACAGSVSPWQTHLGSEESAPDAAKLDPKVGINNLTQFQLAVPDPEETANIVEFMRYYNYYPGINLTMDAIHANFRPYRYGWPTEVALDANGEVASMTKHFAVARISSEVPLMMPDNRTMFISEDGDNTGFYMFVADQPQNLSSGQLYAAKFRQIIGFGGGTFDVAWVDLGHATADQIAPHLANTTFTDIFDVAQPAVNSSACPAGFQSINAGLGLHNSHECLRIRPGMELLASRLEARRYAALRGATTELTKTEGLTFSAHRSRLYISVSQVRDGMTNNDPIYDLGGNNDIRVERNLCGCVMQITLNATFVPVAMEPLICGKFNQTNVDTYDVCDLDGISEPDNLAYIPEYDALIIDEDTTFGHRNDAIWYLDLQTGDLTRTLTVPFGAESSSAYWYGNVNGWAYAIADTQHRFEESDMNLVDSPGSQGPGGEIGYLGPFLSFARAGAVDNGVVSYGMSEAPTVQASSGANV